MQRASVTTPSLLANASNSRRATAKCRLIKLTQAAADRLSVPAEKAVTYWDNQCPGFGLRVSPRNRRTWLAMYRVAGKSVMQTLGTMAQVPKVDEARARARASMTQARDGGKPGGGAARKQRGRQRAKALTFREVAERFLVEHVERNSAPKYAREVRRILDHDVLPLWRDRPAREIKRSINDLLDAKADSRERKRKGTRDGATVQANRTLTRLRTLFRWAINMDLIETDPTAGVRQRVKEKARDRALADAEIRAFWTGCDKLGWPFGPSETIAADSAAPRRGWRDALERARPGEAHLVNSARAGKKRSSAYRPSARGRRSRFYNRGGAAHRRSRLLGNRRDGSIRLQSGEDAPRQADDGRVCARSVADPRGGDCAVDFCTT